MSKCSKRPRLIVLRINWLMTKFWSFGFVSFGIVSDFVLRYSNFLLLETTGNGKAFSSLTAKGRGSL